MLRDLLAQPNMGQWPSVYPRSWVEEAVGRPKAFADFVVALERAKPGVPGSRAAALHVAI
jgi:hypothetical protein